MEIRKKLIRIGSSSGIIFDKVILESLKLKVGDVIKFNSNAIRKVRK